MTKMKENQDRIHEEEERRKHLFEKQMKEIEVTQKRIIEEEEGRKQLFEEQMRKIEENQDRIHEEEERRKQLFEKQMEILKIKEEEFDKKLHEIKTRIGQRIDDENKLMNDEDYPIFVKTESMKNIQLFVHPGETIAQLKQNIEKKTNLQKSIQDLRFGRYILKDENTIGDYGINRYTVIKLNTSIKIFIERETSEKITFNCCLEQSIQKLKKMIQSQTDINPEDQDLVYKGKLLKNEEILTFRNNSIVKLIYRPLELTFKTLTGKEFALKFSSKDKISDVKEKLFQEEGYPPDQIKLIFNGRELENDKNIQNYSMLNNSIIRLVPS